MAGDTLFKKFHLLKFLLLLWIADIVHCQECSTTGLDEFDGYRYIFYHGDDGVTRTFADTRDHCQSLGGDVPVITSQEQNEFLAQRLRDSNNVGGNYWIGLEDIDGDGQYTWIDRTVPGYTADNWNTAGSPEYRCGLITSGLVFSLGSWRRLDCLSTRRHICQIPIDGCRWHELGDSQYLIKTLPVATVTDARATCWSYGGDLAMIKTAEINTFIKGLLPSVSSSYPYFCYWFGLQGSGGRTFFWIDGSSPEYYDWQGVQPNDNDNDNPWGCLGIRDGPTWYDQRGTSVFPYICERSRVFDESNIASFGGIDYFISPSWLDRSYPDARTYCQYHDAELALIKMEDTNTFLHGSGLTPNTCPLFGLTDQATEGTFEWLDGTPLQFSPWSPGEPNSGGDDEDCVCLLSDESMKWLNVGCSTVRPFLCESYQVIPTYEWIRLGETEYYISQTSMTSYSFARKFCQTYGGDLAQPKTEEINMHLIELAEGNSYWIGLDDLTQANTLQWIDDTLLENNMFPTWSNGNDATMQDERCVHQQVDNGWRKLPCTSYLRFACEKPLSLPGLNGSPIVLDFGPNHALIGWRQWDPDTDTGAGPVAGYKIYVLSSNRLVLTEEIQAPNTCSTVVQISSDDATIMIYNVSGLDPGTTYTVQIAAIRDGLNGEGEPGPAITITTETPTTTTTNVLGSTVAVTTEYLSLDPVTQNGSIINWIPFGISFVVNIILAGVIALLCFRARRSTSKEPPASSKDVKADASPDYENPVLDASKVDDHNYQELMKVNTEDRYQEIRERPLADYVNTSNM